MHKPIYQFTIHLCQFTTIYEIIMSIYVKLRHIMTNYDKLCQLPTSMRQPIRTRTNGTDQPQLRFPITKSTPSHCEEMINQPCRRDAPVITTSTMHQPITTRPDLTQLRVNGKHASANHNSANQQIKTISAQSANRYVGQSQQEARQARCISQSEDSNGETCATPTTSLWDPQRFCKSLLKIHNLPQICYPMAHVFTNVS